METFGGDAIYLNQDLNFGRFTPNVTSLQTLMINSGKKIHFGDVIGSDCTEIWASPYTGEMKGGLPGGSILWGSVVARAEWSKGTEAVCLGEVG